MFDKILNWKLLNGSHTFPGPDGGTCITEAALVAGGFEYKSIRSASDLPPCFSRPIGAFFIMLNDRMPNDLRQLLMPYVTRLAGTADTEDIEHQRAEYLAMAACNVFAADAMDAAGLHDHATTLRAARTLPQAAAACAAAACSAAACAAAACAEWAELTAEAATRATARAATATRSAGWAATAAARAAEAAESDDYWRLSVMPVADGLLAIGRRAYPIETALVVRRMDEIRSKVSVS